MDRIIQYANKVLDKCSKCANRGCCHWIVRAAENVVLKNCTPEQYAQMTYEEIANRIHEIVGNPTACLQDSYDSIMHYVEQLLEEANYPILSKDLLDIVNKMVKLEQRLKRLDPVCRDAFDAPIRSIVERSLSALDYHFLDMGIDISSLILSIHSDYHRTRILNQYYIETAVNVLLAKAKRVSVEDIITCNVPLVSLAFPLTPSTSPVPSDPAESQRSEQNKPIKSWVDEFTDLIVSNATFDFLGAVIAYMGYSPFTCYGYADEELRKFFIAKGTASSELYIFYEMQKVYEEIESAVREKKDDDFALKLYMAEILSPFSQLASGLFGKARNESMRATQAFIDISPFFRSYSLDEFKERWDKAVAEVSALKTTSEESFYNDVASLMVNKYDDIPINEHGPLTYCLDAISDILFRLTDFESCIEAALLRNHVEHDYHYYEEFARINLGSQVSDQGIFRFAGITPAAIQSLSKDLKHNIRFAVRDGESIDEFYERLAEGQQPEGKRGDEEYVPLPNCLEVARPYLNALRSIGYLNTRYGWAKLNGTTNNHAILVAKVICNKYPDITYDMLGKLFGIPNLGSYWSRAKERENVKRLIVRLFSEKGLSATID